MVVLFYQAVLCCNILFIVHGEHLTVNWTEAGTKGSAAESHLEDPAMKPLAPCPCDLTSNFCNPNCCCDKDCSSFDKTSFSCLQGLDGGQSTDKIVDNNCKYEKPYSPEWHDFLCFITENNPYLGLFYKPEPSLHDFKKYLSRLKSHTYSYEDTTTRTQDQQQDPYYVFGSHVETVILTNNSVVRSILSLPQQILNGLCVNIIPIHFLEDFSYECSLALSSEVCTSESRLSAATYLQKANGIVRDPYEGFPQVIGNLTNLQIINVSVEYTCLQDTYKFIKLQGFSIFAQGFPSQVGKKKEYESEECNENDIPFYNETSQMCENVVLSVEYNIGWRGPSISEVNAKIMIGTVPVSFEGLHLKYFSEFQRESLLDENTVMKNKIVRNTTRKFMAPSASSKLSLLQHFTTSFHHMGSSHTLNDTAELPFKSDESEMNITEEFEYLPSLSERSGNPGYEVGKPIIGGYVVYNVSTYDDNTTSKNFLFIEADNSTGLYMWQPDESGGCKTTQLEVVTFGVDMISACLYSWSNMKSCTDLREMIQSVFQSLIQLEVVSKLGWPNFRSENDFLPIIVDAYPKNNHSYNAVCQVPFSLEYRILYQDISDVTTKNALSVYQVIGAHIKYHHKEILFHSDVSEGSLSLTTSVTFMKHPRPLKLSRFWEAMQDRWCLGGTCWREILQPWTHGNTDDSIPSAEGYYTTHVINLVANSAIILLITLPLIILTIRHSHCIV
nr:tectonic-2-like [Cherax quadricarinatus]